MYGEPEEKEYIVCVVNGTGYDVSNIKDVSPPASDGPFWQIRLKGGEIIQATGIVTVEYRWKR